MTRKEEREHASNLIFKIKLSPRTAFIRGAEWADQHPRKGLVDIEKVIKYMNNNSKFDYLIGCHPEILSDLRKAMEE